jgi:hypothetical protein
MGSVCSNDKSNGVNSIAMLTGVRFWVSCMHKHKHKHVCIVPALSDTEAVPWSLLS